MNKNFSKDLLLKNCSMLSRLAEVLGMKVKSVRLFFIYASFTTLIGGFLIYLTLAFWLKLKDMIARSLLIESKKLRVFDFDDTLVKKVS